jgi:hypothetical protein
MTVWFRRWALGASLILISGCAGSQSTIGGAGAIPQALIPTQDAHLGSWILPEAKAQDLIYVSLGYLSKPTTYILSLPQGKLVGEINAAGGLFSDNSGNVWMSGYRKNELAEFAHGGVKPIKILRVPRACAIDPASGNIATIRGEHVHVYTSGSSSPQDFVYKRFYPSACTYDGSGDLFILGNLRVFGDSLGVAELSKGATKFQSRKININHSATSGFSWDGKYLVIGDSLHEGGHELYRYAARGNRLKSHGWTELAAGDFTAMANYSIQGSLAVVTAFCGTYGSICPPVYVYNYPGGGQPIKTIGQGVVPGAAGAVTISVGGK